MTMPRLYRETFDQVEPMHERIVENFRAIRDTQVVIKEPTGIYKSQDSRMDAHQWRLIEQFKLLQDELQKDREAAKTEARRTAKAKLAAETASDGRMNPFSGAVDVCTICLDEFVAGDQVCRLLCRHVFHEKCLKAFMLSCTNKDPECPECRGSTNDPKAYVYIAESQFIVSDSSGDEGTREKKPASPIRRATPDVNSSTSSTWSQVNRGFFPLWRIDEPCVSDELCFHGNTALTDGRQGLLVDPGAWNNLAGEIWTQKMAEKALKAGYNVAQGRLQKPMKVAGVGNGTNNAEWEVRMPIALSDVEGNVTLNEYHVPVVGGMGKELPALLGLQCMARQNSILEMAPGHEFLTLPGPGGYTIHWSPGTVRYKLEKSPSGHLLLPCDAFQGVTKERGGLKEPTLTFFGSFKGEKVTCDAGTQTDSSEVPVRKSYEGQHKNKVMRKNLPKNS
jgi:hypothetical protein